MRFRVPLRLKSTSSLAVATAASWQGVGRCLRLRAVSLVRRGDQAAGLRLRADQAGLPADSPGIGDRAGVLNGGDRARIPFPRGLDGVAVAESAPRISGKTGSFPQPKNRASGFAGGLRLFSWGSNSPESGHRVQAAGVVSRRALIPANGQLTPLTELVGSRCLKDNFKHLPERNAPPLCEAEEDDGCGDLIQGELTWSETVGSDGRSTEFFDLTHRTLNHPSNPSEAVPVILSATSDDRRDALCKQGVAGRFAVVSAICDEDIQITARPTSVARNTWGVIYCLQDLSVITTKALGVPKGSSALEIEPGR